MIKIENIFLQEIGHAPILLKEEELALLKALQKKGPDCDVFVSTF